MSSITSRSLLGDIPPIGTIIDVRHRHCSILPKDSWPRCSIWQKGFLDIREEKKREAFLPEQNRAVFSINKKGMNEIKSGSLHSFEKDVLKLLLELETARSSLHRTCVKWNMKNSYQLA
jgi:hypothetical protein